MIHWLRWPFEFFCPALSRSVAARLRSALQQGAEILWALGFGIAGRCHRREQVISWSSDGRKRVLVIAPHPDDEAIGCGGTLMRHKACGDQLCIAYITDGRGSQALKVAPEEMARRRKTEAQTAAAALKIERFDWFNLSEGDWSYPDLRARLRQLINDFAPDIIYAPSRVDIHPEHHKVAHVLALALLDCETQISAPLIRIYQIQVPLTAVLTNLVVDTSSVEDESRNLLDAYPSQYGSTCRAPRKWRYAAWFYGAANHTEEFLQLSARQYGLLHEVTPEHWPTKETYRALQSRSYSDPLAYLWGLSERRRLVGLMRDAVC